MTLPKGIDGWAWAVLLGAALVATEARAGAWPQKKGRSYTKLSVGYGRATDGWGKGGASQAFLGERYNQATFTQGSVFLYGEYGLTDRLTGIALIGAKRLRLTDELDRYTTTGLSDGYLGLKWQAATLGPAVVSLQAGGLLPTGYHRDYAPPLGTGQYSAEGRLLVGASLWPIPAYASAEVGYRHRTEWYGSKLANSGQLVVDKAPFPDEMPYFVEAGYTVANRYLLRVALDGVLNLSSTQFDFSIRSAPRDQSYLKVNPSVIVTVTPQVQVNLDYGRIVSGQNTAAVSEVAVGVALTF